MVLGIAHSIYRHKVIGHDAATTIYRTLQAQSICLQRVGEGYLVGTCHFAAVVTVEQIILVLNGVVVIRFLYSTACWSVITCYGKTYHRAVGQLERTLYKALAECTATNDETTVPILYCTSQNL